MKPVEANLDDRLRWAVVLAFVWLAMNPRVFDLPLTLEDALDPTDS